MGNIGDGYASIGDPASPISFCSNGECFEKDEYGNYKSVTESFDEPVDEGYYSTPCSSVSDCPSHKTILWL